MSERKSVTHLYDPIKIGRAMWDATMCGKQFNNDFAKRPIRTTENPDAVTCNKCLRSMARKDGTQ